MISILYVVSINFNNVGSSILIMGGFVAETKSGGGKIWSDIADIGLIKHQIISKTEAKISISILGSEREFH